MLSGSSTCVRVPAREGQLWPSLFQPVHGMNEVLAPPGILGAFGLRRAPMPGDTCGTCRCQVQEEGKKGSPVV